MNDKSRTFNSFVYASLALVFTALFLSGVVTDMNTLLPPDQLKTFSGDIAQLDKGLTGRTQIYHPTFTLCEGTQCLQVKSKNGFFFSDVMDLSRETGLVTITYQPGYMQAGFPFEYNCAWSVVTARHVYIDGNALYTAEKAKRDSKVGAVVDILFGIPALFLWIAAIRSYRAVSGKKPDDARRSYEQDRTTDSVE